MIIPYIKLGKVNLMSKKRMEEEVFKVVTRRAELVLTDKLIFTGKTNDFTIPYEKVISIERYMPDVRKMHSSVFLFYLVFVFVSWTITGVDFWVLGMIAVLGLLHWATASYIGNIFPWLKIEFEDETGKQTLYLQDSASLNFFDFLGRTEKIKDEIQKLL